MVKPLISVTIGIIFVKKRQNSSLLNPTVITLPFYFESRLPSQFQTDDNRFPKQLVNYFISQFTQPGDIIFDPFSGYGTTLIAGKELGRKVIGTEIDAEKVNYLSNKFELDKEILLGDVRKLVDQLPELNFVMTSPPYMSSDEKFNPLLNYKERGDYQEYLTDIQDIFELIKSKMKSNSHLVVEVANLKSKAGITTLAWDIGKAISNIFEFKGEVIVNWVAENKPNGNYSYGYDHSYCLIFLAS